jgi:hypothetical protein
MTERTFDSFEELLKFNFSLEDVGQLPDEFYTEYKQATHINVATWTLKNWLTSKRLEEEHEAVKADVKGGGNSETRNFGIRVYVYDKLIGVVKRK